MSSITEPELLATFSISNFIFLHQILEIKPKLLHDGRLIEMNRDEGGLIEMKYMEELSFGLPKAVA